MYSTILQFVSKLFDDDEEYTVETRDASPGHLLVTIDDFSSISRCRTATIESLEFESGSYKWKLAVEFDNTGEHIIHSVYLSMVDVDNLPRGWEVNVIFTFSLYNHISNKYVCFRGKTKHLQAIDLECGFSNLMTRESFIDPCNGYLFKDKFVYGADVFVIQKEPRIEKISISCSYPYERNWKITDFSKIQGGNFWASEDFSTQGYKWRIKMYPDGHSDTPGRRYVSILLECVDTAPCSSSYSSSRHDKKMEAACSFSFRNETATNNPSPKIRFEITSSGSTWQSEFIAVDDMRNPSKGFVVDDCCILKMGLRVSAMPIPLPHQTLTQQPLLYSLG